MAGWGPGPGIVILAPAPCSPSPSPAPPTSLPCRPAGLPTCAPAEFCAPSTHARRRALYTVHCELCARPLRKRRAADGQTSRRGGGRTAVVLVLPRWPLRLEPGRPCSNAMQCGRTACWPSGHLPSAGWLSAISAACRRPHGAWRVASRAMPSGAGVVRDARCRMQEVQGSINAELAFHVQCRTQDAECSTRCGGAAAP